MSSLGTVLDGLMTGTLMFEHFVLPVIKETFAKYGPHNKARRRVKRDVDIRVRTRELPAQSRRGWRELGVLRNQIINEDICGRNRVTEIAELVAKLNGRGT
ncbi:jg6035 [Pararge aegeria aegeria]|uniref:Jg6034 protein n=1 Tax=Pararge aegeria aegeria TaxID=348720 RepID=A0A8S4QHX6_9NEOP|nr:jg6034 [Pararge aegeria aegeria]CAH2207892.1 jg6035 [Pararge aegeria aegeria]